MENVNDNEYGKLDDELNFRELFTVILNGKWIIFSFTSLATTLAVIYSLLLPNIYESKALIAPVNPTSSIAGSLQNYKGIAGLAGISLPASMPESNSSMALKKISSLSFFEDSIFKNIYLPNLMAVKSWDPQTNILVLDENIFNTKSKSWVRDYSYPRQQIPTAQESFEIFVEKHLKLSEDKQTGFINLSIKHRSPYLAKQWVELIINEINNFYRHKDKLESEKAVNYLNKKISMTSLSEIKEVLAELLQEETQKLTLIEANTFYVFEYIDPPAVMEKKSEPNRALICIASLLLAMILSIVLVLVRHYILTNHHISSNL